MYAPRLSLKARRRCARLSPASARETTRIRRTLTMANSEVTKKPFARTRRKTASILRSVSIIAAGPARRRPEIIPPASELIYGLEALPTSLLPCAAPTQAPREGKTKKAKAKRGAIENKPTPTVTDEGRAGLRRNLSLCLVNYACP